MKIKVNLHVLTVWQYLFLWCKLLIVLNREGGSLVIYEDVYRFLLKDCSSKEFDIVLNLINNTDWNSVVKIDMYDLARKSGTTIRYVKDVMNKFMSVKKGKKILAANPYSEEFPYILLIGKSSLFYTNGDKYCKKFSFLYSKEFQELSIYAKRVLLASSMGASVADLNEVFLNVHDFVYRNDVSSGLIPSKRVLINTLNEININFKGAITASLTSSMITKEEGIRLDIEKGLLDKVEHNYTERSELRRVLFEHGYFKYLPTEYCIEIEKTAKYIFNSMIGQAKKITKDQGTVKGLIDDTLYIARNIYKKALGKLSNVITKLMETIKEPEELSAYFSSVVFSTAAEEMAKHQNQADSIRSIGEIIAYLDDKVEERWKKTQSIATVLQKWCEDWAFSRCQKEIGDQKVHNDKNVKRNDELKDYIKTFLGYVEDRVQKLGNKSTRMTKQKSPIRMLKDQITDYLDMVNSRMLRAHTI